MINFEQKIPEHIAGYIKNKIEIPVVAVNTQEEKERPLVAVICDNYETSNGHFWAGDIIVRLESLTERPVEVDNIILKEIKEALLDTAAFDTYMYSLPTEERQGWMIKKFRVFGGNTVVDSAELTRDMEVTLRVALVF